MDLFNQTDPRALPFQLPRSNDGYECIWSEELRGHSITVPNGALFYSEHYFAKNISDRFVEYCLENNSFDWRYANWRAFPDISNILFKNINWKQDSINMFGKDIPLPRLTSWYGDGGKEYTYSGISSKPNAWNRGLLHIKNQIEQSFDVHFNSVLLNWYRDGEDYLNWHSDNEKELGLNPTIASANFGQTRDFAIRRKDDKSQKMVLPLKHGTLLIMSGELQHYWEHSVPKRKKVTGSRFNLTFRQIS